MSEYPEYEELQELRAADRRSRAGQAAWDLVYADYKQRVFFGAPGTPPPSIPRPARLSRAQRRARGRRVAAMGAFIRDTERARTAARRAHRPVIKKGLTR